MPELPLVFWKGLIEGTRDHVLDTDEASILFGGVIDETLTDIWRNGNLPLVLFTPARSWGIGLLTFVQMTAVMIRLHATMRIVGVNVECIEVGADVVHRAEVLTRVGSFSSNSSYTTARQSRA